MDHVGGNVWSVGQTEWFFLRKGDKFDLNVDRPRVKRETTRTTGVTICILELRMLKKKTSLGLHGGHGGR